MAYKIGILGAGNVGETLGRGWAAKGHSVRFGVRDPKDPKNKDLGAPSVTISEAAAHGDVIAVATPWPATKEAIQNAGNLAGKILLDCTNPLEGLALDRGFSTSGGEQVAVWAKGAKAVKIFNTTGSNNMADPNYNGQSATMFYCGDDAEAKKTAAQLAADLGFDPIDAGPLTQARHLEPMAMLWISMAIQYGYGRDMAFKLLRR